MSSTLLTDNALSRPAGLVVSLRLLAAIVIFAAIAPGILMTAPAVAAQLASEWQLKPGQIGWLFSAELSLSAVWTFIGTIGSAAGLSPTQVGLVLAAATVCGIIGAGGAALRGTRRADRLPVWLGYGLLIVSVGLLIGQPLLVRYAIAALLFKFTWTFVLPFILARVAGLDNSGRLMNSINLVIGGGMAAGPALAGALLQHFASADPLLAAAGVCALLSLILIVAASAAGKA
ncbi:hypothetical protein LVW24_21390 [Klebsiella pneumoniae]|nr:hypothetical protein [Klebsiella pneumoniae]